MQLFQTQNGYYQCGNWTNDKAILSKYNPFVGLPFIIDGETVVATAAATSNYLAHKFGLAGENETERDRNQQALAVVREMRSDSVRVLYAPHELYADGHRGHLEHTVCTYYSKLSQWLQLHGTPYLCGHSPASADFELWEMLDMHEMWANDSGCKRPLAGFNELTVFYDRMRLLPRLQGYFDSRAFHLPGKACQK